MKNLIGAGNAGVLGMLRWTGHRVILDSLCVEHWRPEDDKEYGSVTELRGVRRRRNGRKPKWNAEVKEMVNQTKVKRTKNWNIWSAEACRKGTCKEVYRPLMFRRKCIYTEYLHAWNTWVFGMIECSDYTSAQNKSFWNSEVYGILTEHSHVQNTPVYRRLVCTEFLSVRNVWVSGILGGYRLLLCTEHGYMEYSSVRQSERHDALQVYGSQVLL